MTLNTARVTFRVSPIVKSGLERLAVEEGTSVAELVESCVNYFLTGNEKHIPSSFQFAPLPPLDDVAGWDELTSPL